MRSIPQSVPFLVESISCSKTKNDEYEINVFQTQFVSGAKEDANGNLVWTPSNSAKGHEFSFRVNYALSGLKEIPGGAIQITIPKSTSPFPTSSLALIAKSG